MRGFKKTMQVYLKTILKKKIPTRFKKTLLVYLKSILKKVVSKRFGKNLTGIFENHSKKKYLQGLKKTLQDRKMK